MVVMQWVNNWTTPLSALNMESDANVTSAESTYTFSFSMYLSGPIIILLYKSITSIQSWKFSRFIFYNNNNMLPFPTYNIACSGKSNSSKRHNVYFCVHCTCLVWSLICAWWQPNILVISNPGDIKIYTSYHWRPGRKETTISRRDRAEPGGGSAPHRHCTSSPSLAAGSDCHYDSVIQSWMTSH